MKYGNRLLLGGLLGLITAAPLAATVYTDEAAFLAAAAGPIQTEDLNDESLPTFSDSQVDTTLSGTVLNRIVYNGGGVGDVSKFRVDNGLADNTQALGIVSNELSLNLRFHFLAPVTGFGFTVSDFFEAGAVDVRYLSLYDSGDLLETTVALPDENIQFIGIHSPTRIFALNIVFGGAVLGDDLEVDNFHMSLFESGNQDFGVPSPVPLALLAVTLIPLFRHARGRSGRPCLKRAQHPVPPRPDSCPCS